jgi:hypothetical protein
MATGRYAVRRHATECLEVDFEGTLDAATVMACERELRTQLAHAPNGLRAVVNLIGVSGYQLEARDHLVAMQRFIGSKATQTAYTASSAEARGLGLWVVHSSQSQLVKLFGRAEDASSWLDGVVDAQSGVRKVDDDARRRRRTTIGRKRAVG